MPGILFGFPSSATERLEYPVPEQRQEAEHHVHVDFRLAPHPNVSGAELVLEPAVAPLRRRPLLVALAFGGREPGDRPVIGLRGDDRHVPRVAAGLLDRRRPVILTVIMLPVL